MTMSSALIDQVKRRAADEAERHAYPAGFPVLPPVPSGRYADPEFAALEDEEVFGRSWLMVAHADELPEPGSYLQVAQLDKPIVLVRGDDGQVRAFYNTCKHRGAALVAEAAGNSRTAAHVPVPQLGLRPRGRRWSATPRRTTSPTSTGTASPSPRSGARRGGRSSSSTSTRTPSAARRVPGRGGRRPERARRARRARSTWSATATATSRSTGSCRSTPTSRRTTSTTSTGTPRRSVSDQAAHRDPAPAPAATRAC